MDSPARQASASTASETVETATPAERAEFLEEYFPRNVWPTDDQRAVVERSLGLVRTAGRREGE